MPQFRFGFCEAKFAPRNRKFLAYPISAWGAFNFRIVCSVAETQNRFPLLLATLLVHLHGVFVQSPSAVLINEATEPDTNGKDPFGQQ